MAVDSHRNLILIVSLCCFNLVFCNVHVLKIFDSNLKYPFIPLVDSFPEKVDTYEFGGLTNRLGSDGTRVSERKCEEYIQGTRCEFEENDFDPSLRKNARVNEFPHMAFLGRITSKPNKIIYTCSGSLISPRFVLTTANCVMHRQYDSKISFVSLGDHNVDPSDDRITRPLKVLIKDIHMHPEYVWPNRYNDIALLELESEVPFSNRIRPACLWTKDQITTRNTAILTTMGSEIKKESNDMKKLSVLLIRDKECNASMHRFINKNWKYGVDGTQICGQEATGNSIRCKAVLGSPMMVINQYSKGCAFHIAGVTAFKFYPNCFDYPIVLTRVSSYVDWIEKVVWPED